MSDTPQGTPPLNAPHPTAPPEPPKRSKLPWLVALGLLLANVGVYGAFSVLEEMRRESVAAASSQWPDDDTPYPEDRYPAEVDGFTLSSDAIGDIYDKKGPTVLTSERISVTDRKKRGQPAVQSLRHGGGGSGTFYEVQDGIYCADGPVDTVCFGNDASQREWETFDLYSTLDMEELAAWTRAFLDAVEPS
ncbi:MAG: hypothetical protein Q4F65_02165 [Propionibacteriaceae bacterium]|nr:hypothetical protein [Propionibacteriaceae bacterium]